MALSFSEQMRGSVGGRIFRTFNITADGSTTTINASDLGMHYIESAVLGSKANLTGSATWDASSIAQGAEEAKDVTVTGAALGDFAVASHGLDVEDLVLDAQVTAGDTVTCVLANNTGAGVDLGSTTVKATVFKHIGLSTQSGSSIVFSPALTSSDTFNLWVVGY